MGIRALPLLPLSESSFQQEDKLQQPVKSKSVAHFFIQDQEDRTAVQLMAEYDLLPAVCNCCSKPVNPDGEERTRRAETIEFRNPVCSSCLMISDNL